MAKIGLLLNRRAFLKKTALAGVGLAAATASVPALGAGDANEKLVVAVMGLGRGMGHVSALLKIPNVEIAYLCDVDMSRLEAGRKEVERSLNKAPPGAQDFRRILDDKAVDALFIATPNHWHAPATILACAAGKHVYVEKPGRQNPAEGEMMVASGSGPLLPSMR